VANPTHRITARYSSIIVADEPVAFHHGRADSDATFNRARTIEEFPPQTSIQARPQGVRRT